MRAVILFVLVLLGPLLFAIPPQADAQALFGTILGPEAVAPRRATEYNVSVAGGPVGVSVNYSLEYYLEGSDLTGASPVVSTPGRTSGNRTTFRVNVTAPDQEQTVTLVVKISASTTTETENATIQRAIIVLTPIVLSATFRNNAETAALNVLVRFYVDDAPVGTQTIARLAGGTESSVSVSWIPVGLQPGAHQVRVEADLDGDGIIDPARGEAKVSEIFIRESAQISPGWNVLIALAVFVPAFIATVALRRRKHS